MKKELLTLCFCLIGLWGAGTVQATAPVTPTQPSALRYFGNAHETLALVPQKSGFSLCYALPGENGTRWNWFYLSPERKDSYTLREEGPTVKADSTVRLSPGGSQLVAGRYVYPAMTYTGKPPDEAFQEAPYEMAPDEEALIGYYHGGGDVLLVREHQGELELLYELEKNDRDFTKSNSFALVKNHYDAYTLMEKGPYTDTSSPVRFDRNGSGLGISLRIGNHSYSRIFTRGENDRPWRVKPVMTLAQAREKAKAFPVPSKIAAEKLDLVSVSDVVSTAKLDLRYSTANNLFGEAIVSSKKAELNRKAAQALSRAAEILASKGYGLLIWEGYRSYEDFAVAKLLLGPSRDSLLPPLSEGYSHNTGRSLDVSLYDLETGTPIKMISDFDELSPAQFRAFPGGTDLQRYLRGLLDYVMTQSGFNGSDMEWWHYEYKG